MKKFLYNWSPVLAYFAVICILSSLPLHAPQGTDKIWHILEFTVMGFIIARGVLLSWNLPKIYSALIGIALGGLFGVFDELHQLYVPGRESSIYDAMADLAGTVIGTLLFIYVGVALYKSHKLYSNPHDNCCG
jgi:VanZ family protein